MYGKDISPELAKEMSDALEYDPETGSVLWAADWSRKARKGRTVGSLFRSNKGTYKTYDVRFKGVMYRLHRVIMAIHLGGLSGDVCIDHIDGNGTNNSLQNLRVVDHAINMQNRHRANKNSTSGIIGVSARNGKYRANITIDGKSRHIGVLSTEEDARAAFIGVKRLFHAGCTI